MFITKISHPKQVLIVTPADREYWRADVGIYYMCTQAYDALSSSIKVIEEEFDDKHIA